MKDVILSIAALAAVFGLSFLIAGLVRRRLTRKPPVAVHILIAAGAGILVLGGAAAVFLNIHYPAQDIKAFAHQSGVTVTDTDGGYFINGSGTDKALIFYPGAMVDADAYLPLMTRIAESGTDCFLPEMPARMAIFDANAADKIRTRYDYDTWILAGHSMGGMIAALKKLKTRSGAFMAFVTVEDLYGSVECVCFPKVYDKIRNFLEADKVVSVSGKMSIDADKLPAIIVDRMEEFSLDEKTPPMVKTANAGEAVNRPVAKAFKPESEKRLWLNVTGLDEADIEELMETLTFYEGETPVIFVKDGKKMMCSQKVSAGKALMAELAGFLPESCVKLT